MKYRTLDEPFSEEIRSDAAQEPEDDEFEYEEYYDDDDESEE